MKVRDFMKMVQDMRSTQKEYFSTRSGEALKRSKNLEMQVDQFITRALGE